MEGSGRRFDAYIRVSRVAGRSGPSYISPKVQREAIQRWADYQNITIAEWHIDEDQSGGTQNRPGLRTAIERVETGEIQGIACWKLSRFARNVSGALADIERIRAGDGDVVFVAEQIDTAGPIGQFILTLLLAVATLERDNMTAGFEIAKQLATARGAKVGPTPYGYMRLEDGTLDVHPDQGEHIAEAYRLAAARGLGPATDYLQQNAAGRTWTSSTVRRLLANRSYLGEQRYGDQLNPTGQPPLVSRAIWEAAQVDGPRPKGASEAYPLSGIAVCGTCRAPMVGARSGPSLRMYRCSATLSTSRRARCARGAMILADTLEQHVRDQIRPLLARVRLTIGDVDTDRGALLERAILEAEAELDAFAGDLTMRRALGGRYHEHLQARVDAIEAAQAEYRAWDAQARTQRRLSAADEIAGASDRELAEWLRGIAVSIVVAPGRGDVAGRVGFVPLHDDLAAGELGSGEPE